MTNKKISLVYEGDESLINAAINALAISDGWSEDSSESKEDAAKRRVTRYIREDVKAYNIALAKKAATEAAEAASSQALELITVSLEVE